MRLGILQAGHIPDEVKAQNGDYTALYSAMLHGHGFEVATFSVVDGEFPNSPQDAEAWLVSGSRHGAYEDHDWIPPLEALIRAIKDQDIPLVGICFGHQIIAQALGGEVEKFDGGWSVGRQSYKIGAREVNLNAWHQDQVVALPMGATRLGSSSFCENAVLAYGPHILTIQPHPEFSAHVVETLIEHRAANVPKDRLAQASAALPEPLDNAWIAAWIADVLMGRPATEARSQTKVTS